MLDLESVNESVINKLFLITAILLIASKDRTDLAEVQKCIWDYLRQKILDVALGASNTRKLATQTEPTVMSRATDVHSVVHHKSRGLALIAGLLARQRWKIEQVR